GCDRTLISSCERLSAASFSAYSASLVPADRASAFLPRRLNLRSAESAGGEDEACGVEYRVNDDAYRGVPPPLHNPREQQGDRQQHHEDRPPETPMEQAPWDPICQPC